MSVRVVVFGGVMLAFGAVVVARQTAPPKPAATATNAAATSSVLVVDTAKGPIEIELFRADAPKSVDHIVALVKKDFYRGLRFHRVVASLAQFGDPLTRNFQYRDSWGSGPGSGNPIGVAEISKKHSHVRGAVGLATAGTAADADSQMYIMKVANAGLDGKYAVIGQVTRGMDVVDKIAVEDLIKNITVK